MEGRRAEISRVERGRRRRKEETVRLAWWVGGAILVALFMVQNDLLNVTGVLAVLGVIEVVAKAWKMLGDKVTGE